MKDKKSINILHVSTPKSWRGGENQCYFLMEYLKSEDVNQHILCSRGGVMDERRKQLGIKGKAINKLTSLDLHFAYSIKKYCEKYKISHVHCHDAHAHTFAFLSVLLFKNKSKLIISRRVDFPIKDSFFSKLKYNHPSIKAILCVSDAIKEITAKDIKNKSLLHIVYSGVDMEKFNVSEKQNILRNEYKIPSDILLIGNTSAIAPHKDYFTFIATAKELLKLESKVVFFIIGDGPLNQEIQQKIVAENLSDKIIMTGFRNDIVAVLPALDIFLMTSETEGLGTSLIDAMLAKVPIVATHAGGIPELINHKKNGLLADVKDAKQLAHLLNELIKNPDLKKEVIENAQQMAKKFDKKITGSKTLEIYLKN